jgi:hypothetical protein
LAAYVAVSVAVTVALFAESHIVVCFGTAPTGQTTPECMALSQASHLARLFDTLGGVALFTALTAATWVVTRVVGRRRASRLRKADEGDAVSRI